MSDQAETKTLGVDEDPHANDVPKATIQEIIWNLLRRFQGEDVRLEDVTAALSTAIAEAGLPEQPKTWVESTATEIASGRDVIMDVKDQVEPEQIDVNGRTVEVLGTPDGIPGKTGGKTTGPQPTPSERAAE